MTTCACRIAGPLGIGAVLGETPGRKLAGPEGYYGLSLCPLHAAAPDLLAALEAFLRAPSSGSAGPGSITIEVQTFNLNAARAAIAKALPINAPASGEQSEPAP